MSPAERARLKAAVDQRRRELELRRDAAGHWKRPRLGQHRLRLAQKPPHA